MDRKGVPMTRTATDLLEFICLENQKFQPR